MNISNPSFYEFTGEVKKNIGRGTKIGFKTANIGVKEDAPEGVFVGYAKVSNNQYESLIFIGKPVTFDDQNKRAEVFILNFNGNLYGEIINVKLYKKIRENKKFSSKEDLVAQINQDKIQAHEFFSENNV